MTNPLQPEELVYLQLAQLYPLGPSGFAAGYEIGHVWSDPGGDLKDLDIHAETQPEKVYLDYAILRSLDRNLIATVALSGQDANVDVGGKPETRDRYRWVTMGATYDDTIAGIATITELAFNQGIDGMGSTGNHADFEFASLDSSLSRDFGEKTSAELLVRGQYAFTGLPSMVKFDVGGEPFGRAFDPGAISGRDGIAATLEVSRAVDLGVEWLAGFNLFGFVDYGAVWNGPDSDRPFADLGSFGGGIRTGLGQHLNAMAMVATPYLDDPKRDAGGTRFHFAVGGQF